MTNWVNGDMIQRLRDSTGAHEQLVLVQVEGHKAIYTNAYELADEFGPALAASPLKTLTKDQMLYALVTATWNSNSFRATVLNMNGRLAASTYGNITAEEFPEFMEWAGLTSDSPVLQPHCNSEYFYLAWLGLFWRVSKNPDAVAVGDTYPEMAWPEDGTLFVLRRMMYDEAQSLVNQDGSPIGA